MKLLILNSSTHKMSFHSGNGSIGQRGYNSTVPQTRYSQSSERTPRVRPDKYGVYQGTNKSESHRVYRHDDGSLGMALSGTEVVGMRSDVPAYGRTKVTSIGGKYVTDESINHELRNHQNNYDMEFSTINMYSELHNKHLNPYTRRNETLQPGVFNRQGRSVNAWNVPKTHKPVYQTTNESNEPLPFYYSLSPRQNQRNREGSQRLADLL